MPELPEVETVVRALQPVLIGRKVTGAVFWSKVRTPFDAKRVTSILKGRTFTGVRRRAKYILLDFDSADLLVAHLGMTGYFHVEPADALPHPHDRLALKLDGGEELRFADARRFGFVDLVQVDAPGGMPATLDHLGLEPLERSFTAKAMAERAQGRSVPVKVFIMNQEIVVGVGNIYASEALFSARIDPHRLAGDIALDEWKRLTRAIKAVLRSALRAGGSTVRNYRSVDGSEGQFQRVLRVYDREGQACMSCGEAIAVTRQGGRSTYYCPNCQR